MQATPRQHRAAGTLVVVPTYRECENLALLRQALQGLPIQCDLLVIDDAGEDGSAERLRAMAAGDSRLAVIQRPGKLGLGTAYTLALAYARARGYWHVVQMDADHSHDPQDVARLVRACGRGQMVLGSRYVRGGACQGWPRSRRALSKAANWLVARVLRLPIEDATGGFRCTHGSLLRRMPLEQLHSVGFGWQWEFNRLVVLHAGKVRELPICFRQRLAGKSKMSLAIALESLCRLMAIWWRGAGVLTPSRPAAPAAPRPAPRKPAARAAVSPGSEVTT